jgi:hypothetical protein
VIEPQIADQFRPYLGSDERITWTGIPRQGVMFSPSDAFLIPFSLMWGGFAIFWEASVLMSRAGPFFELWGIPFVAIGLFLIFGRFIADAWVRARTLYVLTNRRALIIKAIGWRSFASAPLGQSVSLKNQSASRGTIEFGSGSMFSSMFRARNPWMPGLDGGVRFLQVEDVMEVYRLAGLSGSAP